MHLTIATAGHIDHGKSALVQALTGTHPDRLPEEQARGISIELGFAHARLGDTTVSFIDVPGHERFVRTMLAGVGGIDAVLLVVAADESVMPQTREHFAICRLLDVPTGVIALTKCDVADETSQAIAEEEVRDLVAGSALATAEIVRVSARTRLGLETLRAALRRCAATRRSRDAAAPVRLPIDRVFTVKGFGTVVTGTLWAGTVHPDRTLMLLSPSAREPRTVRVRGVQVHGAPAAAAFAGQRAAVNLGGVGHQDVQRGDVLVEAGMVVSSRRLAVDLRVLPDAAGQRHGARLHVHLGTSAVLGRLILPTSAADDERAIAAGGSGPALLRLETALPVRRGDRLVLRAYSPVTTVGGATVLDPLPPLRTRDAERLFGEGADVREWFRARVYDAGEQGLSHEDVPARCGVVPAEAAAITRDLAARGHIVAVGPVWVAPEILDRVRARVLRAIDEASVADPMAGGVPRATLRGIGGRRWRAEIVDHVLDALGADGSVSGGDRLTRAAVPVARDAADARVLSLIGSAGLQGRTLADLEGEASGLDRKALAAVLGRLARDKAVERVGDAHVASFHLLALTAELRALGASGEAPGVLEVGWFKERYGLTRRTAIPLLEWLDRTRVTRRQGDARVLIVG